jgi:hypothetical protein
MHCGPTTYSAILVLLGGALGRIAGHRGHTVWYVDPVLLGLAPHMKLRLKRRVVVQGASL